MFGNNFDKDWCTYHYSQYIVRHCDIIIAPYNYLICPKQRNAVGLKLANNIIVWDECHNIIS